jgi:hypothetical protein
LAINFSPLEKKKNAPDAPPWVRRSLIVVAKYLNNTDKNKTKMKHEWHI